MSALERVHVGKDDRRYTIRFPPGPLPPVNAFWSLTIYDNTGYLVDNPINRYNLGSKDDLVGDADGGLTVRLSVANPHGAGSDETSNWLPIPLGQFSVQFRAYWPDRPIVHSGDGWQMVPVQEQTDCATP
jgi:hypothetical protein